MDNLEMLLEYQAADIELTEADAKQKDTPTRKKLLQLQRFLRTSQDRIAEMEGAAKVKNTRLSELSTQHRTLMEDMEDLEKDLSYYSECDDEELDEAEIRKMTGGAERLYDSIIKVKKQLSQLSEELDEDARAIKTLLGKMKSAKTEYDSLKLDYNKEIADGAESLKEYEQKLAAIEAKLPQILVDEYKRIKGFRQNPVAVFKDSRCGGCNMQLPSSTSSKITAAADKPYTCENCGRILILQ